MNIISFKSIITINQSSLSSQNSVSGQKSGSAVTETALKSISSSQEDKKSRSPLIRLKNALFPQPARAVINETVGDIRHPTEEAVCFLNENRNVKALESWVQGHQSTKNELLKAELGYVQELEAFYKSEKEVTENKLKSVSDQLQELDKKAQARIGERKGLMQAQSRKLTRYRKRIERLTNTVETLGKEIGDLESALKTQKVKTQGDLKKKSELLELQNSKMRERNSKKKELEITQIRLQNFRKKILKQDARLLNKHQNQAILERNSRIQLEKEKADLENSRTEITQWLDQLQVLKRAKYKKVFIRSGNSYARHLNDKQQDALIKTWMENPGALLFSDEKTGSFSEKKEQLRKIQEDPDTAQENLASLYLQLGKKTLALLEKNDPYYGKIKELLSELKSVTVEKNWGKAEFILAKMSRLTQKKSHFTLDTYFDVINHPKDHLSLNGDHISFSPLPFKECKCSDFSHLESDRREKLEAAIVEHILKNVPKSERVNLLSMGCGDLLEEWFVIGKLIQKGYYNFDLVLVDPKVNEELVQQFEEFFENFPEISLRCTAKKSIEQVDQNFKADAIFAIDFDAAYHMKDAVTDVLKCFSLLSDQGRYFFGAGSMSYIISKSKIESFIEVRKEELSIIKADIKKALMDNPDIPKFQIVADSESWDHLIYLLHDMTEKERQRLEIYYVTRFNDSSLKMIHHCLSDDSVIGLHDIYDKRPEQPAFVLTGDTFQWEKTLQNKSSTPIPGKTTSLYLFTPRDMRLIIGSRSPSN